MTTLVLLIVFLGVFLIPTIIALNRNRAVFRVFLVNLFLGWSVLGWIVALWLSLTQRTPRENAERLRL